MSHHSRAEPCWPTSPGASLALSLPPVPAQPPRLQGGGGHRSQGGQQPSLFLSMGSLPSPHPGPGLWTAICSSLRNSSSLASGGSWPAEPEWKISEANGAAMREPEPRARPWGGSAWRGRGTREPSPPYSQPHPTPTLRKALLQNTCPRTLLGVQESPLLGRGQGRWSGEVG